MKAPLPINGGDWIEHLAFGQTVPKLETCLGLSIGLDAIFVSEVRRGSKGKPAAQHLLRIPMDANPAGREAHTIGALNTEFLSNAAGILETILPEVAKAKLKSRYVVVSLSQNFGLLRYFTMPGIDRRYWNTAIPAEAQKHIPLPFGELAYDFTVRTLPSEDKRPRLGVLFAVTYRKNLEGLRALIEGLGWELLGLEIAPCSVERLWDAGGQAPKSSYVRVHFDGGAARLMVSDLGWPILYREIYLDADAKTTESRKIDLAGCIDFSKKQLGLESLDDALISGSVAQLSEWKDIFSQESGLSVNMVENSPLEGELKTKEWGAYSALGCALQFLVPTASQLDLSQSRKVSPADKRAATAIFTAAAVLAVWFLFSAVLRFAQVFVKSREFKNFERQTTGIAAFQNKSAVEIGRMVEDMQTRVSGFNTLSRPQARLTYLLEDISDSVPVSLWVSHIDYTSPGSGSMGAGAGEVVLSLKGHVVAPTSMAEQDIAAQFRQKLQSSKRLGSAFTCSAPSITVNTNSGGGGGYGALGDPEERTMFTIECKAKRT